MGSTFSKQYAKAHAAEKATKISGSVLTNLYRKPIEVTAGERIGYGAAGLGLGLVHGAASAIEGIGDFFAGTALQIVGDKEGAKEVYQNSWSGDFRKWIEEEINPDENKAFSTYLDVVSGVGNAATQVGLMMLTGGASGYLGAGATAVKVASVAPLFISATGSGTAEAVQTTGELGAKENIYGALTGSTELATEMVLGAGGKILKGSKLFGKAESEAVKGITKHAILRGTISSAAGEFGEEAMSEAASVWWKQLTGVDPNAKLNGSDIVRAGFMGAVSGGVLGFGNSAITARAAQNAGRKIIENGTEKETVAEASALVKAATSVTKGNLDNMDSVQRVKKALELYQSDGNAPTSRKAYYLGQMSAGLFEVGMYESSRGYRADIFTTVAQGGEAATKIINGANALFEETLGRKLTAEDFSSPDAVGTKMLASVSLYNDLATPTDAELVDISIRNESAAAFSPEQMANDIAALKDGEGTAVYNLGGGRMAIVTKRKGDGSISVGLVENKNTNAIKATHGVKSIEGAVSLVKSMQDGTYGQPRATATPAQPKKPTKKKSILDEEFKLEISEKNVEMPKKPEAAKAPKKPEAPKKAEVAKKAEAKKKPEVSKSPEKSKTAEPKTEKKKAPEKEAKAKTESEPKKEAPEEISAVEDRLRGKKYAGTTFTAEEINAARADFKYLDALSPKVRSDILIMRRSAKEAKIDAQKVKGLTRLMAAYKFGATFSSKIKSNGFWRHGKNLLVINPNDIYQTTFGHELSHRVEDYKGYDEFASAVESLVGKARLDAEMKQYLADYNAAAEANGWKKWDAEANAEDLRHEAVANIIGKYLSNAEYIDKLANADRNFVYRIYRSIKGMKRDLALANQISTESDTSSITEYRTIRRMEKVFETALGLAEKETNGDLSRSLSSGIANREKAVYNEEQYNRFGWAREAGAITKNELDDFEAKIISQKESSNARRSPYGEKIVEVNDDPHKTLGVDNVFVFYKGTIDNYIITRTVRFDALTETEMEAIRRNVYEGRACSDPYIKLYQKEGLAREYRAENHPAFDANRKRRSNRETSRGADSDHRGRKKYGSGYSLHVGEDGEITERFADDISRSISSRIVFGTPANTVGVKERAKGVIEKVKGIITDKAERRAALEKLREASDHFSVYASNSFAAVETQLRRMKDGTFGRMTRQAAQEQVQLIRVAEAKGLGMLTVAQYKFDGTPYEHSEALLKILEPTLAKEGETITGTDAEGNEVSFKVKGGELGGELYQEVSDYLVMLNAIEREAVGKNPFGNMTVAEMQSIVSDYESKHPEFKEIAEKWSRFNRNLLQYRVDAGLISQDTADELHARYPHYIPMMKPTTDNLQSTGAVRGKTSVEVANNIRKAKGGDHLVNDPIATYCNMVLQTVKAAQVNDLMLQLYKTADDKHVITDERLKEIGEEMDNVAESYINDPDSNPDAFGILKALTVKASDGLTNAVYFYEDGVRKAMKVSKDIFTGLQGANKSGYNFTGGWMFEGMAAINSNYKRLITSMNPFFSPKNMIRDFMDGLLHSRFKLREFLIEYVKVGKDMAAGKITDDPLWSEFIANGGLQSSLFDRHDAKLSKRSKRTGLESSDAGLVGKTMQTVENFNVLIEALPRFTEYKLTRNKGGTVAEAINNSAEVTTNFARSGVAGGFLNKTIMPFLNPSIQGFSKPIRNVIENGTPKGLVSLLIRAALLGVAPIILNNLMYGDDEDYDVLEDSTKENNFVIKIGNSWLKIPRGRVVSVVSGLYNRSYNQMTGRYVDWKDYLDNVKSQATPIDSITRTIFSPFKDVQTNTTWYGGIIENESMQNLAPEDRYDEYTSSLAIAIGKVTGKAFDLSPKKVHYLLDQYSGIIGDLLLPMTSTATRSNPLSSNFSVDVTQNTNLSDRFYKIYNDSMYKKNKGDEEAYYLYKRLGETKQQVSELYKQIKEINTSNLSKSEKRSQVAVLRATINQLYKAAIADAGAYSKAVKAASPIQSYYKVVKVTTANAKKLGAEKESIGKYALTYNGETVRFFDDAAAAEEYKTSVARKTTYAEANRLVYGAQYALNQYSETLGSKAETVARLGVDAETFYSFYMTTRYYSGSDKKKQIEKYCKENGLSKAETSVILYFAGFKSYREEVQSIAKRNGFSKSEIEDL